ncbi:ferredoxin-type protein NapG, partial [Escherichia coli]|nr:ferredoxin-type protein NapG [Escherichia coli]
MSRSAKPQNGRRRFLRDVVRTAGGLAAVGVALGLQQQTARASGVRLRPPGAINENAFASACVRCGQCVQACPYDTLKLATLASGLSAGTPYFVARDIPCEMCEDIPCAKVCPSGALDREIESIDDARMGLAVLVDQENCLNLQGLRCDVCYRECPKID